MLASGYRRIGGRAQPRLPGLAAAVHLHQPGALGENNDRVEADDNLYGIVGNAIAHEPYFPVRQPDGSVHQHADGMAYINAVDLAEHNTTRAADQDGARPTSRPATIWAAGCS